MLGNSNVEDGYSEKIPILGRERRQCCIGCPKRWLTHTLRIFRVRQCLRHESELERCHGSNGAEARPDR
ncbi:hypothetical protein HNY73_008694 [Argiope bruennichi]|uniref:Uncharacterized protein n=1 Tax=Argiope bruennichi TaxID=94029 RepID=A0A8T0F9V2_ARGBR|nr:hypothetical protein HNY73_008694 [Argiope bruennichi]